MWLIWLIVGLLWGLLYIPTRLIKFMAMQLVLWISQTPGLRVRGDLDYLKQEQEIARIIPIGTPVAQAKKIMERNDFKCRYEVHATFARPPVGGGRSENVLSDADILLCHRNRPGCLIPIWPYGWMQQDWFCAFEHKEGAVTRIFAKAWLTGP